MGFWTSEDMTDRLPELVDPFNPKRVVNCAYELSLGNEAFVTGPVQGEKKALGIGNSLTLPPGQFAHLITTEQVRIPSDALGMLSIKSRYKLRGLVNVSGFHVDPGFQGRLLFSVYNAGPSSITMSQGQPFFLLWLAELTKPTGDTYTGGRANQSGISDDDVMRIDGPVATPQTLATRVAALEERSSWRGNLLTILISALAGSAVTLIVSAFTQSP